MTKFKKFGPRSKWTIVRTETPKQTRWYAINTETGQSFPERSTYDKAFEDIPENEREIYAQPWGV